VKRRPPVAQHMVVAPVPEPVAQAIAFIERDQLVDEAERYCARSRRPRPARRCGVISVARRRVRYAAETAMAGATSFAILTTLLALGAWLLDSRNAAVTALVALGVSITLFVVGYWLTRIAGEL